MVFYSILRILYDMELEIFKRDHQSSTETTIILNLLQNHAIYVIPVVNIEGVAEICEEYKQTGRLEYIRKNMRKQGKNGLNCQGGNEAIGVDLNRNYDMAFGIDDEGSSG